MVRFLLFFAILAMFSCSNSNPGITTKDLDRRDSVMLVKIDSVIEHKLEDVGLEVYELDSTSFVLNHAEASAVFKRTSNLLGQLSKFKMCRSVQDEVQFPKGAFDDKFFISSNGERYRMISQLDKSRGHMWVHFTQSLASDTSTLIQMDVTFDVDASGQALSGRGFVNAYSLSSEKYLDSVAADYLSSITRQAIVPVNWMLGEFETMIELEHDRLLREEA